MQSNIGSSSSSSSSRGGSRDGRTPISSDEHYRQHRPTTNNTITTASSHDSAIVTAHHPLEHENARLKTLCGSLRDELEAMEHSYRTERKKSMEYRSELEKRREDSIRVEETVDALRTENQRLARDLRSLRDQTDLGSAGSSSGSSSSFNRISSGIGVGAGTTSFSGGEALALPSVIDRMELGNTPSQRTYTTSHRHALSIPTLC